MALENIQAVIRPLMPKGVEHKYGGYGTSAVGCDPSVDAERR